MKNSSPKLPNMLNLKNTHIHELLNIGLVRILQNKKPKILEIKKLATVDNICIDATALRIVLTKMKSLKLPKNMQVEGDLDLIRSDIKKIPENFHVRGDFNIWGCDKLESIGEGLCVAGNLDIHSCFALKKIPKLMYVFGDSNV